MKPHYLPILLVLLVALAVTATAACDWRTYADAPFHMSYAFWLDGQMIAFERNPLLYAVPLAPNGSILNRTAYGLRLARLQGGNCLNKTRWMDAYLTKNGIAHYVVQSVFVEEYAAAHAFIYVRLENGHLMPIETQATDPYYALRVLAGKASGMPKAAYAPYYIAGNTMWAGCGGTI